VDNLCHTLVGAALGEAGLKRRTPLATATLLVGANLPDLDAFTYVFSDGATALELRRGWTHGVLAMAVLPFALAGAMAAWDRLVRRSRRPGAEPARFRALLLLSFISVLSHPPLDFLNTYGMRFLFPFSRRWFYGDALYIVDPWVWIAVGLGIGFSRARRSPLPARAAICAVLVYAAAMLASGAAGRSIVRRAAPLATERVLVSPVPLDPFRRMVVLEVAGGYRYGTLRWLPRPAVAFSDETRPKNDSDLAAEAAALTRSGRQFLSWARFPYFDVRESAGETQVEIRDARYPGAAGSWASVVVAVPETGAHALLR